MMLYSSRVATTVNTSYTFEGGEVNEDNIDNYCLVIFLT